MTKYLFFREIMFTMKIFEEKQRNVARHRLVFPLPVLWLLSLYATQIPYCPTFCFSALQFIGEPYRLYSMSCCFIVLQTIKLENSPHFNPRGQIPSAERSKGCHEGGECLRSRQFALQPPNFMMPALLLSYLLGFNVSVCLKNGFSCSTGLKTTILNNLISAFKLICLDALFLFSLIC